MSYGDSQTGQGKSPSSRRAWIEIQNPCCHRRSWRVALLTEGVDRNDGLTEEQAKDAMVALLAEGVDRNINAFQPITYRRPVALLAEGVDRNVEICGLLE